ncbi:MULTISPECIES: NAD(P)H-dependent flavin oxidoreductase [unclassified Sphingobium]|uniref:NAD(P)H-dependent flavin oxidoreductase n=1 Tax=unclassified Sphingobium TaxID=2611147 RepID=UPI000D16132A|nr:MULTISPECIES: nitronate monooxygenase [unclassified Sphingobium]MBG6120120.1 nitronate monooxygenase [Sphingobium sp. JAI105]PSO12837.1 2-nitropropane dioxygenase [Sphingobium sp. AEW4]TWD05679.1 nitronate monooxygenase [Sphingobium sp. AEW010]TWD23232.1 nitronate monooxygenase [Sphingobium sp. AEW013]TWD25092.1 nitronate monooxygenase [Sphingobium sp. AEW001]
MRPQIFDTRITRLLGIRHPILFGGLGPGVSDGRYVAAAVNAGCMGFVVAAGYDEPDAFLDELRLCRELTGGKPFGANLYISRLTGSIEKILALIPALVENGVKVVETAGQSPEPLIPALHAAGILVLHKSPGVRYARTALRLGADGVIVVGAECGGHPGTIMIGTMVQAAHAPLELDVPIVIAGGIGNGGQLASVLAMGGDAVLMGTRGLVASELWIHEDHKRRVARGNGSEGVVIKQALRDNHRVLRNKTAEAVLALDAQGVTDFEAYRPFVNGRVTRQGYKSGDSSEGTFDWGQSAIFADRIEPMEAIVDRILDDAVAARARLLGVSRD